jgi:starch phosphorylase
MEIGIRPEMHTYAGGLGILAGDVARSAADLELPMVFVTLASRQGYLRQEIDRDGRQVDRPDPWEPAAWATPLSAMIAVQLDHREVWIRAWLHELRSPLGTGVPIVLLDTNLEQNDPRDRTISDRLYGGAEADRLKQEAVLGIGGERMLRALGFGIETYHLNEGHAALLPVSLLRRHRRDETGAQMNGGPYDTDAVRQQCVFTTHTPVDAGHDRFLYEDVSRILGDFIELDQLRALGGQDRLNMTRLALNLSGYVNGVARRHAETARQLFPGYHVRAITNGIHVAHWAHPAYARLFGAVSPQWCHEPETLARTDRLADASVWSAHVEAKRELIAEVAARTGVPLDPERPILGFARRMTGYKRPDLLFSDLDRLKSIQARFPFQVVIAGKAHPRDEQGQALIHRVVRLASDLRGTIPLAFLPNYDMELAKRMVSGSDIWLNTPLPPLEASGTSGMKAALNGVLNLSILDGWWIEACEDGVTGWAVDDPEQPDARRHAGLLYDKLETVVLPLYYGDRSRWIWMMKQAISRIGSIFNSQHMMRRYASEAYLR